MNTINRSALLAGVFLILIGILSVMIFVTSMEERTAVKPLVVTLDLQNAPREEMKTARESEIDVSWDAATQAAFAQVPDLTGAASTTGLALEGRDVSNRTVFFQQWNDEYGYPSFFMAWFAKENETIRLIESGVSDVCSGYSYGTSTDGFYIEYVSSPCEAGATFTTKYYDNDGNLIGTLNYGYGFAASDVTFEKAAGEDLTISLVYGSEQCSSYDGGESTDGAGKDLTARLIGISVNGKTTRLSKPRDIACEDVYGGENKAVPSVGRVEYLGGDISVGLPGGGKAFVSLQKGNAVSFEE